MTGVLPGEEPPFVRMVGTNPWGKVLLEGIELAGNPPTGPES